VKIKMEVLEMLERGDTIFDIAEELGTTPEVVLQMLGIQENPFEL
tara:strand:- start:421 stop:555 length:135 start_codon:yes stop_codon:yes gene_type:complete